MSSSASVRPYDRGGAAHSHFIALRFLEAAQQQDFQGLTSHAQNRSVGRYMYPSTVGADQGHIFQSEKEGLSREDSKSFPRLLPLTVVRHGMLEIRRWQCEKVEPSQHSMLNRRRPNFV